MRTREIPAIGRIRQATLLREGYRKIKALKRAVRKAGPVSSLCACKVGILGYSDACKVANRLCRIGSSACKSFFYGSGAALKRAGRQGIYAHAQSNYGAYTSMQMLESVVI
jgi:hypothetical protein